MNINASTILSSTTHNLSVDNKKIKYKLNGEEKNIPIDINDLASKPTDAEKKAYIKTQIERAFGEKSLSIDETSLTNLVERMFSANPSPSPGGPTP